MAQSGLCLGSLGFRLYCVSLHEGGQCIMKGLPFRWGVGSLHVFSSLWISTNVLFCSLGSTLSLTHTSSGGTNCLRSHIPVVFSQGGLFRESVRHPKKHRVSKGFASYASRAQPASAIISPGYWRLGSNGNMDVLALEAKNVNGAETEKKSAPRPKPKPPKKPKRIVYFEVEIIDLKTKEKLLLLDKVSVLTGVCFSHLFQCP